MQDQSLFREHCRDLPFRGAVDARIGPALFPAVEVCLRVLERLETQSLERRFLRVPNGCFDLSFSIRMANATRQ